MFLCHLFTFVSKLISIYAQQSLRFHIFQCFLSSDQILCATRIKIRITMAKFHWSKFNLRPIIPVQLLSDCTIVLMFWNVCVCIQFVKMGKSLVWNRLFVIIRLLIYLMLVQNSKLVENDLMHFSFEFQLFGNIPRIDSIDIYYWLRVASCIIHLSLIEVTRRGRSYLYTSS